MHTPGSFVRLKRFGDTHAPRECVFPPGKISAQVNVILPAEQKANPRATTRQELVGAELVRSWGYAAQPSKATMPNRQGSTSRYSSCVANM